jgi:hypothetical protein
MAAALEAIIMVPNLIGFVVTTPLPFELDRYVVVMSSFSKLIVRKRKKGKKINKKPK